MKSIPRSQAFSLSPLFSVCPHRHALFGILTQDSLMGRKRWVNALWRMENYSPWVPECLHLLDDVRAVVELTSPRPTLIKCRIVHALLVPKHSHSVTVCPLWCYFSYLYYVSYKSSRGTLIAGHVCLKRKVADNASDLVEPHAAHVH